MFGFQMVGLLWGRGCEKGAVRGPGAHHSLCQPTTACNAIPSQNDRFIFIHVLSRQETALSMQFAGH